MSFKMSLFTAFLKITHLMPITQFPKIMHQVVQPEKVPSVCQLQVKITCYHFVTLDS